MKLHFLPEPREITYGAASCPLAVLEHCESAVAPGVTGHPQGYRLEVTGQGVCIAADDDAGAFYAQQTLKQLRQQCIRLGAVPEVAVVDYPALEVRGISLDMCRDRIPTMAVLKQQIETIASWKINLLILYIEHTFTWQGAEEVWKDATPFTVEEVEELRDFCRQRFITLMPAMESFGHLHRWLRVDKFRPMAECPEGIKCSWSLDPTDPFSLCPIDPRSLDFVDNLWSQVLPHFDGKWFKAGCDETFDLGLGRSKEAVAKLGKGRVYIDFVKKLVLLARKQNRRMAIAGDIVYKHPELIPEIPRECIVSEWGYRPDYDFETSCKRFKECGLDFFLQSSNSSYTGFNGRSYRWRENITRMIDCAVKYHPLAVINAEFGDNGHWNELVTAIPGDAFFAAMAWSPEQNRTIDMASVLDEFIFQPGSGAGQLLLDCGKPYIHMTEPNSSDVLWLFMQEEKYALDKLQEVSVTHEQLYRIRTDLLELLPRLERATGFAERDRLALAVHARWMLLAADVADECLERGVPSGKLLPQESRRDYARRFDDIRIQLIRLRDDGTFRLGGRKEALGWLQAFRDNLCGKERREEL